MVAPAADGTGGGRTDLMEHPYIAGNPLTLQQAVLTGLVDPGRLSLSRAIVNTAGESLAVGQVLNLPNKSFQSDRPLQYYFNRFILQPSMTMWPTPSAAVAAMRRAGKAPGIVYGGAAAAKTLSADPDVAAVATPFTPARRTIATGASTNGSAQQVAITESLSQQTRPSRERRQ